jgi:hypothetical protein
MLLLPKVDASEIHNKLTIANFCPIRKMLGLHYMFLYVTTNIMFFPCKNVSNATILIRNTMQCVDFLVKSA